MSTQKEENRAACLEWNQKENNKLTIVMAKVGSDVNTLLKNEVSSENSIQVIVSLS